jgi:hypothetical protein
MLPIWNRHARRFPPRKREDFSMAVGLLAVAALASTLSGAQAATPSPDLRMAANSNITLRACNHTRQTVLVGSSFIPVGAHDWRNKGWTTVSAGGCENIFVTANRTFYARAEVKGHSDQSPARTTSSPARTIPRARKASRRSSRPSTRTVVRSMCGT